MKFFTLVRPDDSECHMMADSRAEALEHFSRAFGHKITDVPTGKMADYTLKEWAASADQSNPTLHLYVVE